MYPSPILNLNFDYKKLELKDHSEQIYITSEFKIGKEWQVLNDKLKFKSNIFTPKSHSKKFILKQNFEIGLTTKSLFGWPKVIVEIYKGNNSSNNFVPFCYGVFSLPFKNGFYENFEIPLFFPKSNDSFFFSKKGEVFENKDFLITSQNRFGVQTDTVGSLFINIKINNKDFEIFGVDTGNDKIK